MEVSVVVVHMVESSDDARARVVDVLHTCGAAVLELSPDAFLIRTDLEPILIRHKVEQALPPDGTVFVGQLDAYEASNAVPQDIATLFDDAWHASS